MNTMDRKTPSTNCKLICLPVGEELQYTESSDLVCTAANIPKVVGIMSMLKGLLV